MNSSPPSDISGPTPLDHAAGLMPAGKLVMAPMEFIRLIKRLPKMFRFDVVPCPAAIDADGWQRVIEIHAEVERQVVHISDQRLHGVADRWELPKSIGGTALGGDCEDKCLEKRRRLMQAGFPEGSLRLALCMTEGGEAHAVLLIEAGAPHPGLPAEAEPAKAGHWVIDNLRRQVLPWAFTTYCKDAPGLGKWIARSVPGSFWWEKLEV